MCSSLSYQSEDGQDQPVDHACADAVDDHRPCDREDLDRRARDEALGLEFQRWGHHGVCKPRDRHQRSCPGEPRQIVVNAQPRQ